MPEATRVLALRHGQTDWNVAQRIQGHTDIGLNRVGRQQAERLAQAVADALAGEPLAAIYSSDLQRALATAQALAAGTGAPLTTSALLRERAFGRFEGLTHAELQAQRPDDAWRWRQREPGYSPGGGESLDVFNARCVPAVAVLAAAHPGQVVAIVAHGGVLDCLYRAALGLPLDTPRSWPLANAAINRLLFNGKGFALIAWDDQGHLQGL